MHRIEFFGRVFPEGAVVNAEDVGIVNFVDPDHDCIVDVTVSIINSEIKIKCELESLFAEHLTFLLRQCTKVAQVMTNLLAFQLGLGLIVIIDRCIDEIGNNHKFIFNDDRLANIYSFSKETGKYQELLKLIMVEQPIFMALNDLISSIAINDQVMINCARSVEAIRHMICGHGMAPSKAWPIMRSCLNLDHKYIHLITDNSTQHRHGNHIAISADTVREVLLRSWAIMDRFLQYRLNGNKQLSILKFPLLEG